MNNNMQMDFGDNNNNGNNNNERNQRKGPNPQNFKIVKCKSFENGKFCLF